LGLDLGQKRVGLAVSDELRVSIRPLPPISRTSWKKLLASVSKIVTDFDARGLVIGLPLRLDGSEGDAATEARRIARNFELSLTIPVHLQDERLTSWTAEEELLRAGHSGDALRARVDSAAAETILRDFISSKQSLDHLAHHNE
jgi:putative Holliday junction resolvase